MGVHAILIMLLAAGQLPFDGSDSDLAASAEQHFQKGCELRKSEQDSRDEFRMAVMAYRVLHERGVVNAALYRNLGSAHLLADDLPNAILTFHRGLQLAPEDAELRRCLAAAREQVVYTAGDPLGRQGVDPRPWWLPRIALSWLFAAGFICYVGLFICLTRWLMTRRGWLLVVAAACLLVAGLLTGWLLHDLFQRESERERPLVVIAEDGVLLLKGDGLKYPKRYETPVNRGVEARLVHERPGWVQIELSRGEIGWVQRKHVLIDRPESD